ncbi:hypothetical protein [Citrifermentans bremense]|uniref:hypothetical protein n=1 Tax=Citrifermentans bremense TaxID=60035 RepID=UPI000427C453|nr:hypothetical protein [Citrifermentans bremense]
MCISKSQGEHRPRSFQVDLTGNEILTSIEGQTAGIEEINARAAHITGVTEKNASGAADSLMAAKELEAQVAKLSTMVNRFSF